MQGTESLWDNKLREAPAKLFDKIANAICISQVWFQK